MKKVIIVLFTFLCFVSKAQNILVFSKTAGFRHASIKEGTDYFKNLALKKKYQIKFSEDASIFNETELKKYNAVIFLNTTGDILNAAQEKSFERYIQAGGGFMGIHAAADCEYDWSWYNGLVGGYFASHPGKDVSNVQEGLMTTMDNTHTSTAHLPANFSRKDEFYDFKSLKKDALKFLVSVDEKSYKEGQMGDFHPMSWYQNYDGGKAFYTNFGHTPETFIEPLMDKHLEEGLVSVLCSKLDYSKARTQLLPEENRFIKTTLVKNLDEPTELAIMPNGKVIFAERKGKLKVWNPANSKTSIAANFNVYTKFEYGLMGVNLDPNFEKNNWVYVYYTPTTDAHTDNFLSRFDYHQKGDSLIMSSEKVMLRVKVKRNECCHTGGSLEWDSKGNLFLSTGDDTNPFASDGFAPIDFRKDREGWDGLHTSGNTNDLRGKILRITPKEDGTYSIPDGNLFKVGTEKTRPEIYVMGNRNPYRISVDPTTDWLYWGEIGPDAAKTKEDRGPEGIVEFNQARAAGFYGWPIFTGPNFAYNAFDFEKNLSGPKFNPERPENNSTHNTGLTNLPPAQKAMIWYGYGDSKEFPALGKGGANPMGGPVYHAESYKKGTYNFPTYYNNVFFGYEWMRDWIMAIKLDKNGNYESMERFMPNTPFYHPMDMTFSKDGVMYLLEYGMNWFSANEEAQLSKIEYNAGNRKPVVKIKADLTEGAAPLKVKFSSEGTLDYDGDAISYTWNFGKGLPMSTLKNPVINFTKPGIYTAKLNVKDKVGNISTETINIKVGNAVPEIDLIVKGNSSFIKGDKIEYEVKVKDKEDGILNKGILEEDVIVSIDYVEGFDKTMLEQGHKSNESFMLGKRLIEKSDCGSCHAKEKKSIGPAYTEIAKKYKPTNQNFQYLGEKIINGGGGVWGDQAMAAHPQLSSNDAREIVDYILKINDKNSKPVKGLYEAKDHLSKKEGSYLLRATYTDKGGKSIGPVTRSKLVSLSTPKIKATTYDKSDNVAKFNIEPVGEILVPNDESYVAYINKDIAGFSKITFAISTRPGSTSGGKIEIRQKDKTGPLLGEITVSDTQNGPLQVPISGNLQGSQDLYFIFRNPKAEGKPLFAMSSFTLE